MKLRLCGSLTQVDIKHCSIEYILKYISVKEILLENIFNLFWVDFLLDTDCLDQFTASHGNPLEIGQCCSDVGEVRIRTQEVPDGGPDHRLTCDQCVEHVVAIVTMVEVGS